MTAGEAFVLALLSMATVGIWLWALLRIVQALTG